MMKKAELVFVSIPAVGHLVSIVELANRLIARGDRLAVTILNMKPIFFASPTQPYTKTISKNLPNSIKIVDLPPIDLPSCDPSKSPELFVHTYAQDHVPVVRTALSEIISTRSGDSGGSVAGLVLDFFCASMMDLAAEFGLPAYIFVPSGAAFLGLMLHLPTRHARVSTAFRDSEPGELRVPSFSKPVPTRVLPSAVFNEYGGYVTYINVAQRFREAKGIIVNTFEELEPYGIYSFSADGSVPPVYPVGPVLDLDGQAQRGSDGARRGEIMEWLDGQPPASVVFLCFGSMGCFGVPQIKEIAVGLERSGQRFLWSLRRPPPDGEMAYPADCENPAEILPEGFCDRTAGRGMICGWAPQVEVLAHEAIGGFVSHCGWNSILESVWNGVPIATWPLYAEQQLNAFNMVEELGMGVEVRMDYGIWSENGSDLVRAEEVERAVRGVLDGGSEVRRKAREMREESRKAPMDGGSSFLSLGRLIEDLLADN